MRSNRCRAPMVTALVWGGTALIRSRAATGTPITRPNCHPFACGVWMFMHNGFVGSWSRLRRAVEALIPDELYPARIGTTDSEAIFLAILGAGMERPVLAAERILGKITELVNTTDPGAHFRFTAALSNGKDLYAFRYAVNDHANTLYYRESDRGIVIVSEPLDRNHKNWVTVPENHVVVALAGERARILPLFHRHQEAAE